MATHGPDSAVGGPDLNIAELDAKVHQGDSIYEEGDSGHASLPSPDPEDDMEHPGRGFEAGYDAEELGYEAEDSSMLGYGFEAPPMLDPFAQTGDDIYDRPAIDCPYDAPAIAEPVTPAFEAEYNDDYNDEYSTPAFDAPSGSAMPSVPSQLGSTSNDASEEDDDDDAPPPPPAADYDEGAALAAEVLVTPRTEEDLRLSAVASEMLQEAMGIEVKPGGKRKNGKKKKNRNKSSGSNSGNENDGLVVSRSKKGNRNKSSSAAREGSGPDGIGPSPMATPAFQPAALPVDPSATTINELDAATDKGAASVAADMNSPNDALLFRKSRLSTINDALGSSGRVRYTSVSISEGYVAFGCNTGGVYCFERATTRFLQVLPCKDGEITCIEFAQDEHLLAAGTKGGSIAIWRGPWGSSSTTAKLLKMVVEHSAIEITSLAWSFDSKALFSGDDRGLVLCTPVTKRPIIPSTTKFATQMKFLHKAVATLVPDADVIFRCKARIIQLDVSIAGSLLISSRKQTIIADPATRQLWTIGVKPRDGEFGACFGPGTKFPAAFCARPGARVWVAKSRSGQVSATFNLKAQYDSEPSPIISTVGQIGSGATPAEPAAPHNFRKLLVVRELYLISWTADSVVIIDPAKGRLLGWYNDLHGIIDISVINEEIYVLHTNQADRDAAASPAAVPPLEFYCERLALMSPGECATAMASAGNVADAVEMVLEYHENAATPKFLEHVLQSDLTVLRHLASEVADQGMAGHRVSPGESPSRVGRAEAQYARTVELEQRLTEVALATAQLRIAEENAAVESAEQAFMNRINTQEELQMGELVLEATSDGATSDSDGEGLKGSQFGTVFNKIRESLAPAPTSPARSSRFPPSPARPAPAETLE